MIPGSSPGNRSSLAIQPPHDTTTMRFSTVLLIPLLALSSMTSSCASGGRDIGDHWSERSTVPRMTRFFMGYDAEKDGDYRDFAWERKKDINLTLRRYFFNHNPDNPNHEDVASRYSPRPINSPLPNPVGYVHVEGLILGAGMWAASGAFFPFPVDSMLGTIQEGGVAEFVDGVAETVTPIGKLTHSFMDNVVRPPVAGGFTRLHEYVMPESALLD